MFKQIRDCQKCGLCINQKLLLDTEKRCQIFGVGLSAKKVMSNAEIPLSPETNTGMLIQKIENTCCNVIKCLPLTEQQKLRYPNKKEIDSCFGNLLKEIRTMPPKIVFLLGQKVYSSVGKHLNIDFEKWNDFEYTYKALEKIHYVPIHHPSYIYVYKRKRIDDYIKSIEKNNRKIKRTSDFSF